MRSRIELFPAGVGVSAGSGGGGNFASDVVISAGLFVTSGVRFSNTLSVTGSAMFSAGINVAGSATFVSASFDGSVSITGATRLSSTLVVTSDVTFSSSITVVSQLSVSGDVLFFLSGSSQGYLFTGRAGVLALQGQKPNAAANFEIYTHNGNGNDDVGFNLFSRGLPTDVTNSEIFRCYYDPTSSVFRLITQKLGAGTARDIRLGAGNAESENIVITTGSFIGIHTSNPSFPLQVVGATWISGNLNIQGGIIASSTILLTGSATFSAGINVAGSATFVSASFDGSVSITGETRLSSILAVTSGVTLSSTLTVTSTVTISSSLTVVGLATFQSSVTVNNQLLLSRSSNAAITGNTTVMAIPNDRVIAARNAANTSDFILIKVNGTNDLIVGNAMNSILFQNRVGVGINIGNTPPEGTLSVSGSVGVGGAYYTTVAPTNGLIVQGNVGFGNTTASHPLQVTGSAIFSAGITVVGSSTFSGGVRMSGAVQFVSTLSVLGSAMFSAGINVATSTTIQSAIFSGTVSVNSAVAFASTLAFVNVSLVSAASVGTSAIPTSAQGFFVITISGIDRLIPFF